MILPILTSACFWPQNFSADSDNSAFEISKHPAHPLPLLHRELLHIFHHVLIPLCQPPEQKRLESMTKVCSKITGLSTRPLPTVCEEQTLQLSNRIMQDPRMLYTLSLSGFAQDSDSIVPTAGHRGVKLPLCPGCRSSQLLLSLHPCRLILPASSFPLSPIHSEGSALIVFLVCIVLYNLSHTVHTCLYCVYLCYLQCIYLPFCSGNFALVIFAVILPYVTLLLDVPFKLPFGYK